MGWTRSSQTTGHLERKRTKAVVNIRLSDQYFKIFTLQIALPYWDFPSTMFLKRNSCLLVLLLFSLTLWCKSTSAGSSFLSPSQKPPVRCFTVYLTANWINSLHICLKKMLNCVNMIWSWWCVHLFFFTSCCSEYESPLSKYLYITQASLTMTWCWFSKKNRALMHLMFLCLHP